MAACAGSAAEVVAVDVGASDADAFLLITGDAWFEPVDGTNSGLAGLRAVEVVDAGNLEAACWYGIGSIGRLDLRRASIDGS